MSNQVRVCWANVWIFSWTSHRFHSEHYITLHTATFTREALWRGQTAASINNNYYNTCYMTTLWILKLNPLMAAATKIPHPNNGSTRPVGGQSSLNVEASQLQSVELLCTNDQPNAGTSTWQHTALTRDRTSMPSVGFEAAIPASEWPQTYALDRVATGIGLGNETAEKILLNSKRNTDINIQH